MCYYRPVLHLLTFCVFLGFVSVWGCSESENSEVLAPVSTAETTTQPISREMMTKLLADVEKNISAAEMEFAPQVAAVPIAPMQRPPTLAETMEQLRLEFPGNILDDFKTIREIINSETYLAFLKRTYPQESQFQNFDKFWALASVDEERSLEFLNMYFTPPLAEPTAEDVDVLHYMTLYQRHLNVRTYHGEDKGDEGTLNMLLDEPVYSWVFKERFVTDKGTLNIPLIAQVFSHHLNWIKELQETDRAKIQALFREHRVQKGFLRLALEEPVCLGHVLKDFTDVQVFKGWVDGEFSENSVWWLDNRDGEEK